MGSFCNCDSVSVELEQQASFAAQQPECCFADLVEDGMARQGGSDAPAGTLRINATRLAAIHYIAPLIAPFQRVYPDITLDVVVDSAKRLKSCSVIASSAAMT